MTDMEAMENIARILQGAYGLTPVDAVKHAATAVRLCARSQPSIPDKLDLVVKLREEAAAHGYPVR